MLVWGIAAQPPTHIYVSTCSRRQRVWGRRRRRVAALMPSALALAVALALVERLA